MCGRPMRFGRRASLRNGYNFGCDGSWRRLSGEKNPLISSARAQYFYSVEMVCRLMARGWKRGVET